jgi:hypothetical protein
MLRLIDDTTPKDQIRIDELKGCELIAYRSNGSKDAYCVLSPIDNLKTKTTQSGVKSYAFVSLAYSSGTHLRYQTPSWHETVKLASKHRQLYVFSSMRDMLAAMVDGGF